MCKKIRGIECTLEENKLENFLQFISKKYFLFVVPWCMVNSEKMGTQAKYNMLTSNGLNVLAQEAMLELVLHAYAKKALPSKIETYADFMASECEVCLIYYDCGMLEIYIKNHAEFNEIWGQLQLLHAQDMFIKTDDNDGRYKLYL